MIVKYFPWNHVCFQFGNPVASYSLEVPTPARQLALRQHLAKHLCLLPLETIGGCCELGKVYSVLRPS